MIGLGLPHHDGSELYVSESAPTLGDEVTVRLRVPRPYAGAKAFLRTTHDGEGTVHQCTVEQEDDRETWWTAQLPIRSPSTSYRFLVHGEGASVWVTGRGCVDWEPTDAHDFRVVAEPGPPGWLSDAIFYQIFPDRFAASGAARDLPSWATSARWDDPVAETGPDAMCQLYGGDLDGIAARLDHVTALGANALYLTPIFPAGSNHRYNASTFDRIDPVLGGDEALARLTEAAHRRGIHVIGDLTTNHTGHTHDWFSAAQADASSPEAGFFLFDEHPHRYESWFGIPSLPKLDHRDPELRRRLYEGDDSIARRWLRPPFSLDGWRIDVANMTGRFRDVDVNADVARAIRRTMRAVNPDTYLLAEHTHDHSADLDGTGWHGSMNYSGFQRPVLAFANPAHWRPMSGRAALRTMREYVAAVPWRAAAANLNLLGSHDTPRITSVIADPDRRAVALGLLATWVGVPSIFAGDEVGLPGPTMHTARSPFPWDEAAWDSANLAAYRRLFALRRSSHAIRHGGLRPVHAGVDSLTFLRESAEQRVLVHAVRRPIEPLRLDAAALGFTSHAPSLLDGDDLVADAGGVALPGDGPRLGVWELP